MRLKVGRSWDVIKARSRHDSSQPLRDSPSVPHVIELAPSCLYPLAHVKVHVGLPEAAPPAHEAPAVVVEAVALMAEHATSSEQVG